MNTVFGIIIGLLVLMILIIIHELGHFIAARRNGVKVEEFGIGFPPRAIAWTKDPKTKKWHRCKKTDKKPSDLVISLNWLPIGGFCAMKGESDSDKRPASFGQASFWQKTKILFAGVTMNWLAAFIILTILALTGMPKFIDNQFMIPADSHVDAKPVIINKVEKNSPAYKADLQPEDQIIRVNGQDIHSYSDVVELNQAHAGESITYTVIRQGKEKNLTPVLNTTDDEYLLGVSMRQEGQTLYRSTWSAPIVGAATTVQLTGETFKGLCTMVWQFVSGVARQASFDGETRSEGRNDIGKAGDSVSGPVGIIGVIFPAFTETGPTNLAFLAALISVSLACMNVLPIPALDGGRWFLIAIYRLRGKTLEKSTEERIVSRAFLVLLILIVLITILDITRFF